MASSNATASGIAHTCSSQDACEGCLANSNLAAELTNSQIGALFKVARTRRLSRGEVLITEGDNGGPLFVVAKGQLEVARIHTGESTVPLGHLGPGMLVGQLTFFDDGKRTATVTAAADGTCVLAIERSDVEAMLHDDPLLVYRIMRAILRSAAATIDNMNKVFADSVHYIQS